MKLTTSNKLPVRVTLEEGYDGIVVRYNSHAILKLYNSGEIFRYSLSTSDTAMGIKPDSNGKIFDCTPPDSLI